MYCDVQTDTEIMGLFHPTVRRWFTGKFGSPSPPQRLVWPAISRGEHVLTVAPTGSGKTLAAFLMCLNVLIERSLAGEHLSGIQVVYISPLKALNNDIYRNLTGPLSEISQLASEELLDWPEITVAVRTGDTPPRQRAAMLKHPPNILVTTPETLYLMLTGPKSRDLLQTVKYVIVDEIHALCGGKRGVHLSLTLERLVDVAKSEPVRIGLSATQRPLERVGAYLGGCGFDGTPRPVTICNAGMRKSMDLVVASPVPRWKGLESGGVWDGITRYILESLTEHRTVMAFVNARMSAERLTARLNAAAGEQVALCHHGSISREMREEAEGLLKSGELRCLVATSTMELGIDVGFVDLVVQVESPKSVSGGLQRVGRAGHLLLATSKGRILPKTRLDILECALIASRMAQGEIEETKVPEGCLDVLAQQVVAVVSVEDRTVESLLSTFKRSYCYRNLAREDLVRVIGMLSGRITAGAGVIRQMPRLVWDKVSDCVMRTDGSRFLALRNAGTIPDRGLYTVYLGDGQVRLGELDEVFVYESRIGDTFILGSSVYRIEEISGDKVIVGLTASNDARMPFWIGDMIGRPYKLSREMGRLARELTALAEVGNKDGFVDKVARECAGDIIIAESLWDLVIDQLSATGAMPDDVTIVIEYFSDGAGDSRGVIHALFGNKVNYILSRLISRRILSAYFVDPDCVPMDNGIIYGIPKSVNLDLAAILRAVAASDLQSEVMAQLRATPVFSSIFRQCTVRALVVSRPRSGRMPLWMQKQRSQPILEEAVTNQGKSHPLVEETLRECMDEVFDIESFLDIMRNIRLGSIKIVEARRTAPSPFAANFDFNYSGLSMYRDPAIADTSSSSPDFTGGSGSDWVEVPLVVETIRGELCPLSMLGVGNREALQLAVDVAGEVALDDAKRQWGVDVEAWAVQLEKAGLASRVERGGQEWLIEVSTSEMNAGVAGRSGSIVQLAELMRKPSARWMPMTVGEVANRYGVSLETAREALGQLQEQGLLVELPPEKHSRNSEPRWCNPDVAVEISRRSLTFLRRSISPIDLVGAASFMLDWSRVSEYTGRPVVAGLAGLKELIGQMQGIYLPITVWEGVVFPLRMPQYRREWLDELCASGELVWVARHEPQGMSMTATADAPAITFVPGDDYQSIGCLAMSPAGGQLSQSEADFLDLLMSRGASFLPGISRVTGIPAADALDVLRGLVIKGLVSNDTLSPIRFWSVGTDGRRPRASTVSIGRWFSLSGAVGDESQTSSRRRARSFMMQQAQRYGLLCREIAEVSGEGWTMGQYESELQRMEEAGLLRRGYMVLGLSGMQFAAPEAFERLQLHREQGRPVSGTTALLLPLVDPSSALYRIWLSRLGIGSYKLANSYLILDSGVPVLLAESNGGKLTGLSDSLSLSDAAAASRMLGALTGIAAFAKGQGKRGRVEVKSLDGVAILDHEACDAFSAAGFTRGVNSMMKW